MMSFSFLTTLALQRFRYNKNRKPFRALHGWNEIMIPDRENGVTPVIIVLIITITFGLAWFINKNTEAPVDIETQIRQSRQKILDYRPGEWTKRDVSHEFKRPLKIRIGVIGVQGSGKSTLLNSLHFALTDAWRQVYVEGATAYTPGGETLFRGFMKLTEQVTTVDTRGIVDFSARRVKDIMGEISGKRGINPALRGTSEKIDCPIFVFKYSVATGTQPCKEFLRNFMAETKQRFSTYPIMVIPFADTVSNKDQILDEFVTEGMQKSSVFFIENYTAGNHEIMKERHLALLKILEACILRADDNITFRWSKEMEYPWWKKLFLRNRNESSERFS